MQQRIRRSAAFYRMILWLYPSRFRAAFGDSMREAFESWLAEAARDGAGGIRRVWRVTLGEIGPTVVREHTAEVLRMLRNGGVARGARVLGACMATVAAFFAMKQLVSQKQDLVVLATWFALMGAGMMRAGGRGWACNRNAMTGTAAGVGALLLWVVATQTTAPGFAGVALLLVGAATTIGLIVSTLVRLMIEGVQVSVQEQLAV